MDIDKKKKFVSLSDMDMNKEFSLPIIHWINYINIIILYF
jgi:hypothetical protein